MSQLYELGLANTDIKTWPEGLFEPGSGDWPRRRGFMLDMRRAPINTLPQVTPGSDQAFVLSRARFDLAKLTNEDRVRFGQYRQSSGLGLVQHYLPAASNELSHWQMLPVEPGGFGPSTALQKYREESWHDLMAEPDSAGFFSVIRKQREGADYRTSRGRQNLTRRVWEMVEAAAIDSQLRAELFKQIVSPEDCGDLGTQLFNSLGMKVLVSKAYEESTSARALDDRLVRLARSAARLNRVTDEARFEYKRQEQQNNIDSSIPAPDEVEIHLAYETGLAEKLGLPWQSEGMLYRPRSGVNTEHLDAAYSMIIKREQGDGLVNGMIDLYSDKFWETHLRNTHPDRYETNDHFYAEKLERLDELRDAQAEWANATPQTPLNQLARRMESLADQLGIPQAEVFSGEAMSAPRYKRLSENIAYERDELSRQLTREALARAGF
jgi:hypothetical protein